MFSQLEVLVNFNFQEFEITVVKTTGRGSFSLEFLVTFGRTCRYVFDVTNPVALKTVILKLP